MKLLSITSLAILLFFSACKRDFNCTCTNNTGTTITVITNTHQNKAQLECSKSNVNYSPDSGHECEVTLK